MRTAVQLVNEKGAGIPAKVRATMPTYRGRLRLREERVAALGRTTKVATLMSLTDDAAEPVVPQLLDAEVLVIEAGQLRIRGFELHGEVQYGQVWDVKETLSC